MKQVDLSVLGKENPFELIGEQWMLITAGDKDSFNTMTASWGGLPSSRSPVGKPFRFAAQRAAGLRQGEGGRACTGGA